MTFYKQEMTSIKNWRHRYNEKLQIAIGLVAVFHLW